MDSIHAEVAELVDALASGASGRKPVEVQVLSSVPSIFIRHFSRFVLNFPLPPASLYI